MSSNRIRISEFPSLATRESGQLARETALRLLKAGGPVTLDFAGAHPTPSFADEFIGRLAETMGAQGFRESVKIEGADEETRPLLQQVIARRLSRARSASPPQAQNHQRPVLIDA